MPYPFAPCRGQCGRSVQQIPGRTGFCSICYAIQGKPTTAPITSATVESDLQTARFKGEIGDLRAKYTKALKKIDQLEQDLGLQQFLQEHTAPFVIESATGGGSNEATPILVASDWHVEQRVLARETNGLNEFNLDIASARANRFFTAGLRLIKLLNQDVQIHTVVLGLLGDFITGQIHESMVEKNQLPPTQAIVFAQNHLISGIELILNNSPYRLLVVCKMGNHSRNTDKSRIGVENGHSYEFLMYLSLKHYFKGQEDRVEFIVDDSFHTYVDIYNETYRFNHGHTIKFQGGVGGLFIPAYKKIAKWDQAKSATRTIVGHHHTYLDGGNFHCNGSLIGFDERAAGEGFSYEPPIQTLLLVDKKRGQTCKWPIYVGEGQ